MKKVFRLKNNKLYYHLKLYRWFYNLYIIFYFLIFYKL